MQLTNEDAKWRKGFQRIILQTRLSYTQPSLFWPGLEFTQHIYVMFPALHYKNVCVSVIYSPYISQASPHISLINPLVNAGIPTLYRGAMPRNEILTYFDFLNAY